MSLRALLLVTLWLLLAAPAQASVRAWLDRSDIALGETVTLNIEVQGAGAPAPDFSALGADFERRGSSSSSQISLVNGQRSATTLFAVSLQPRREGELEVPPIQVGNQRTPALRLRVGPSPIDTGSGGDVFLEASLEPGEVYVQQQVTYALKLYYAVSLWDGQLDAPSGDGVQAYRLGDDLKYQVQRGGRRYSVIERRFALVPERSGEIELAPARFDGTGLDRGGYGGLLGSAGIRLSAQGKPLALKVRPRPAAAAQPWLPATDLQLDVVGEAWPEQVRVGEPLSLGLQLSARGLVPAQLPELELPEIDAAAVYPDQASSRDRSNGDGLGGERFRRFAIVPQRAGTLEIPAIRVPWWDVVADQQRWAEIPARRLQILPASGESQGLDQPLQTDAPPSAQAGAEPGDSGRWSTALPSAWPWMLLSLVLAVGWWLSLRRRALPAPIDPEPARLAAGHADIKAALQGGDLHGFARVLCAAAPSGVKGTLHALAHSLQDADQRNALRRLERQLYAAQAEPDASLLADLRRAFARGPSWPMSEVGQGGKTQSYPPLYG